MLKTLVYWYKKTTLISPLSGLGYTPGVLVLLVLVEERLDPLVLLEVGQLGGVGELEEGRRQLDHPLGVYDRLVGLKSGGTPPNLAAGGRGSWLGRWSQSGRLFIAL